MKASAILRIARSLPPDCPYFRRVAESGAYVPFQRYELASNDPALVWNLVTAYWEAGRRLPPVLSYGIFLRVFRYLREGPDSDRALALAEALYFSARAGELVKALSICSDCLPWKTADLFGVSAETIILFEVCFWNWRHRAKEGAYVSRIFQRAAREAGEKRQSLLRTAWKSRSVQSVLLEAEWEDPSKPPVTTETLLQQFSQELRSLALLGMLRGATTPKDNPALKLFLRSIKESQATAPEQPTPSLPESVQAIFKKLEENAARPKTLDELRSSESSPPAESSIGGAHKTGA